MTTLFALYHNRPCQFFKTTAPTDFDINRTVNAIPIFAFLCHHNNYLIIAFIQAHTGLNL